MENFDIKNIKAIIGLGNPGQQYYKHRHTVGFQFLNFLAESLYASEWQDGQQMKRTTIKLNDQDILLIQPQTFMNSSGAVLPWLTKKGIKPEQILVVHDELEKPFGNVLIRFEGSHKGHNGLKSIMNIIGPSFWRLKFGIGRPENKDDVPDYVLTNFTPQEQQKLPELFGQALALLLKNS